MTVCEKCGGAGKLRYAMAATGDSNIGGVIIRDLGGTATRACSCVRDLPAIDGKATWWEEERLFSGAVPVPIGDTAIEVTVDGEVPRNEGGRRMLRTAENAYYPTCTRLEVPGPSVTLFGDDARALAAVLVRAADACDKTDAGLWKVTIEKGGKS